jgi:hypothetical protein
MMIRAFASILLSSLILLQGLNIQVKDVLDLRVLLEHLEYHQAAEGDDLYTFLQKHYGSRKTQHEGEEHQDGQNHEKLPFKDKAFHSSGIFLVTIGEKAHHDLISLTNLPKSTFYYQDNYSFLDHTDIFQPPRKT